MARLALKKAGYRVTAVGYPRVLDLVRLALYGIIENCGYRQLTTWWRLVGIVDYFRGKQGWGVMTRKGFSQRACRWQRPRTAGESG